MLPQVVIEAFAPSRLRLLDAIRPCIDDSMLREIAEADYGDRADQHQAALRSIRDGGLVPDQLEWVPGEVLELIRWSEPTDVTHKPGRTDLEGHRMRGFSCAALMASEVEHGDLQEETLTQCLRSEMALDGDEHRSMASFLTYAIGRLPSSFPWIAASGLLLVALRVNDARHRDQVLPSLAEWVTTDEDVANALSGELGHPDFGRYRGFYRDFGREMRLAASVLTDARLQRMILAVATQLEC